VSCFVDLALKRRCVVNVIKVGIDRDRAMMHVHFTVEADELDAFLARALFARSPLASP
jgi:hypothetical protein